jgi:hypothetical protein
MGYGTALEGVDMERDKPSMYHFKHNIVCVSIRHEACEGAAACHAEAAAVVDYNQVRAALFDELC